MDKIKNVAQRLGIITVEDMERYTALELLMMIANKMNEFNEIVNDQNDKIQYLLNDGVLSEVEQLFDEWLQDGTFDTLIHQSALKKVNARIDETNAQLSQEIEETNAQLSQIDDVKATKKEVEIERKRIDSLTKLPSGSTAGDAELIDARIGADGVTYSNVGGAIRTQIKRIKTNIGKYSLEEIDMISGSNIALSVGVGNVVNLTPEVVPAYSHAIISCDEGDAFTVSGTGGENPRLWGFLDAKNVLLSVADANATENNLVLIAPKNASKLVINNSTNKTSWKGMDLSEIIQMNTDNLNKVESELFKHEITMKDNFAYEFGNAGIGSTININPVPLNTCRCALVNCEENDVFLISGTGGNNPRLWGFLDANNVLLSMAEPLKTEVELRLVAPARASKLLMNDLKTDVTSYKGEDITSTLTKIGNVNKDLYAKTDSIDNTLNELNNAVNTLKKHTKKITVSAGQMSKGVGDATFKTLFIGDVAVPCWELPSDIESSVVFNLGGLVEDFNAIKIKAVIFNPTDKVDGTSQVLFSQLCQIDYHDKLNSNIWYTDKVVYNVSDKNIVSELVISDLTKLDDSKNNLITIYRKGDDERDNSANPLCIVAIEIEYEKPIEIQSPLKYTAWPFVENVGDKLVCVYSRGLGHEDGTSPDIYRKTSSDGGLNWSIEKMIINTPNVRDTVTGKGKDLDGNMLMWVRKGSPGSQSTVHHVYMTKDGDNFKEISTPTFQVVPSHIGDIFCVPTVGLMAFYNTVGTYSWGLVISTDNGVTWSQREIEGGLEASECPMEISAVYLDSGKILAIGRKEARSTDGTLAQFQLQSSDYGKTWSKTDTNITDIALSTPSIIYNTETDEISNYYFQRGVGVLKLRKSKAVDVWDNPLNWSKPKEIAYGTTNFQDTGNVNAVAYEDKHIAVYYSGDAINTGIYAEII